MMFQQWKQQFSYNADEKDMSQKLFAVLTSYLRGKCAHLVRAEQDEGWLQTLAHVGEGVHAQHKATCSGSRSSFECLSSVWEGEELTGVNLGIRAVGDAV